MADGACVIAMTPLAALALGDAGIPYRASHEFVDAARITALASEVHARLAAWFDRLDRLLDEFGAGEMALGCPPSEVYFTQLFRAVSGAALRATELQQVLQVVGAHRVTHVARRAGADRVDGSLAYHHGPSLAARLLPGLCAARGAALETLDVPYDAPRATGFPGFPTAGGWRTRLLSSTGLRRAVSDVRSARALRSRATGTRQSIFFLQQNAYLARILTDALSEGYTCLYRSGPDIVKQSRGFHRVIGRWPVAATAEASALPCGSLPTLTDGLDDACGVPVAGVVESRLRYFVTTVAPLLVEGSKQFAEVYRAHGVESVVLAYLSEPEEFAALAARHRSPGVRSVFLHHGNEAFEFSCVESVTRAYDVYVTSTDEEQSALERRRTLGRFASAVCQASERLDLFAARVRTSTPTGDRRRLVYVPTVYTWDDASWIEGVVWSSGYYAWQCALLDLLTARDDYEIIWKALPGSSMLTDPIPELIRRSGVSHVRYETGRLDACYAGADRVLLDYPSTPLYEAAAAGLPVFSLYHRPSSMIRPSACAAFGRALQPYNNIADGLLAVSRFLDAPREHYKVALARTSRSFTQALSDVCRTSDPVRNPRVEMRAQ